MTDAVQHGEDEGDLCRRDGCCGRIVLGYPSEGGCRCHINPPCNWCMSSFFRCPECDWTSE